MSSKTVPTSKHCTFCSHNGAIKLCSACNGAPDSHGTNPIPPTRYCNATCQKAHWLAHKPLCKEHQARKMLYRAGQTAQLAFYKYRENCWDRPIESVDGSGDDLIVYETPHDSQKTSLCAFPHHLFKNDEDKHAVLTYMACTDAVNHMYYLLHHMLEALCPTISKIKIKPHPPNRLLLLLPHPTSPHSTNPPSPPHDILRATLPNGQQYALDIAGAQHNHHTSVTPWPEYAQSRIQQVLRVERWKAAFTGAADDERFMRVFNEGVREWQERNGRLEMMLGMPGRRFREARDGVVGFLDGRLRDFRARGLEEEEGRRVGGEKAA